MNSRYHHKLAMDPSTGSYQRGDVMVDADGNYWEVYEYHYDSGRHCFVCRDEFDRERSIDVINIPGDFFEWTGEQVEPPSADMASSYYDWYGEWVFGFFLDLLTPQDEVCRLHVVQNRQNVQPTVINDFRIVNVCGDDDEYMFSGAGREALFDALRGAIDYLGLGRADTHDCRWLTVYELDALVDMFLQLSSCCVI